MEKRARSVQFVSERRREELPLLETPLFCDRDRRAVQDRRARVHLREDMRQLLELQRVALQKQADRVTLQSGADKPGDLQQGARSDRERDIHRSERSERVDLREVVPARASAKHQAEQRANRETFDECARAVRAGVRQE